MLTTVTHLKEYFTNKMTIWMTYLKNIKNVFSQTFAMNEEWNNKSNFINILRF